MSKHSSKDCRRCFFDVTIDGESAGRIVMELRDDVAPRTCENFAMLCTGQAGVGKVTGKNLHFKGSTFHRVIRGFMIQGGDFSASNGTGGESIYGGTFEDEEFVLKHDEPFVLSMANIGPDTNGSQFFITTNVAKHLDGIHVVFGKVISGKELVTNIENLKVNEKKRPINDVIISNCGQLVRKRKTSLTDSDEENDKETKKSHKHKKRRERSPSSDIENRRASRRHSSRTETEAGDGGKKEAELKIFSTVRPEDLPEEPVGGRGKFLRRRSPSPKQKAEESKDRKRERRGRSRNRSRDRDRSDRRRPANVRVLRSGHRVKGRGVIRYHADDSFGGRDRSATPPHWKREEQRLITLDELKKKKQEQSAREEKVSNEFETFRRADNSKKSAAYKNLDRLRGSGDIANRITFTRKPPTGNEAEKEEESELALPEVDDFSDVDEEDGKSATSMHEKISDKPENQISQKQNSDRETSPKKSRIGEEKEEDDESITDRRNVTANGNVSLGSNRSKRLANGTGGPSNMSDNKEDTAEKAVSRPQLSTKSDVVDGNSAAESSSDDAEEEQAAPPPANAFLAKTRSASASSASSSSSAVSYARSDSISPEVEAERKQCKKLTRALEKKTIDTKKCSPRRQERSRSRSRHADEKKRPSSRSRRVSKSPRRQRSTSRTDRRRRDSPERRRRSRSRGNDCRRVGGRRTPDRRRRDERSRSRRRSRSGGGCRRDSRNVEHYRRSRSAERHRRRSRSAEHRRRSRSGKRHRRRSRSAERSRRSVERRRGRRVSRSPSRSRRSGSGNWRPGAFHAGRIEKEMRLRGRATARRSSVSPVRRSERKSSRGRRRSTSSSSSSSSSSSNSSASSKSSKSSSKSKSKYFAESSKSSRRSSSSAASSASRGSDGDNMKSAVKKSASRESDTQLANAEMKSQ